VFLEYLAGRGYYTRTKLLTSKVSAPRPINLPSLRREHAGMDTTTPVVLGSVTSWGSPSSSPALSASPGKSGDHRVKPQSPVASADTNLTAGQLRSPPTSVKMLQRENGGHSPGLSHTALSQGSPKSTSSPSVQTQPMARAWAIPTATAKPKETPGFPAATETLDQPKGIELCGLHDFAVFD
jgi:hypothetical protein